MTFCNQISRERRYTSIPIQVHRFCFLAVSGEVKLKLDYQASNANVLVSDYQTQLVKCIVDNSC